MVPKKHSITKVGKKTFLDNVAMPFTFAPNISYIFPQPYIYKKDLHPTLTQSATPCNTTSLTKMVPP
jgi:hypothetical protein